MEVNQLAEKLMPIFKTEWLSDHKPAGEFAKHFLALWAKGKRTEDEFYEFMVDECDGGGPDGDWYLPDYWDKEAFRIVTRAAIKFMSEQ